MEGDLNSGRLTIFNPSVCSFVCSPVSFFSQAVVSQYPLLPFISHSGCLVAPYNLMKSAFQLQKPRSGQAGPPPSPAAPATADIFELHIRVQVWIQQVDLPSRSAFCLLVLAPAFLFAACHSPTQVTAKKGSPHGLENDVQVRMRVWLVKSVL